ncbi:adenylosuccinate lyase [Thermodesulfobacteriota bacterium]
MIERYSNEEMAAIWTDQSKYDAWLKVQILTCEALNKLGAVPDSALKNIKAKAKFDVKRILEIEEETKHDVIAFLTNVEEYVGEDSRFIHLGLTSSDVLDTSFAYLLKKASDIIIKDIKALMDALKERAFEHKDTVMIGRSHGIHAEPVTFGLKMALFYEEMKRNLERMKRAKKSVACGKISGAVGTFANIDPSVEAYVTKKLGLSQEPVSTQVVQRDRHAEFFTTLAIIASSIEKIAVEVRHLQRTEVYEAEEFFSKGQKGSSAMPHKRNPVLSENLTGLARLVRANASAALENVALWHERDISHSSVERVIGTDSTVLIDFMLKRATGLIKKLIVYPKNMMANFKILNGLPFSQNVLLALVRKGIKRQDAYVLVQRNAMQVWKTKEPFSDLLKKDKEIAGYLSKTEINELFDLKHHLKHIDTIFERVFSQDKHWEKYRKNSNKDKK